MEKPKGITIPIPAGFMPPEGAEDGQSFDAVAGLVLSGGSLILTELDGIPVSSASEEPKEQESEYPEEESDEDFEASIERGMQ